MFLLEMGDTNNISNIRIWILRIDFRNVHLLTSSSELKWFLLYYVYICICSYVVHMSLIYYFNAHKLDY